MPDRLWIAVAVALIATCWLAPADAGRLRPGDVLVTDMDLAAVFVVDTATGERTIVSGQGVGEGPELFRPRELLLSPDGQIYVSATNGETPLIRIDPENGDRTVVASRDDNHGGGSCCSYAAMTMNAAGRIVAADRGAARLVEINPASGDRRLVGPDLIQVSSAADLIEIDVDHYLLVDSGAGMRIIDATRHHSEPYEVLHNNETRPPGASVVRPRTATVDEFGAWFFSSSPGTGNSIVRLNPLDGIQELIASTAYSGVGPEYHPYSRGDGPILTSPQEIAFGIDGMPYVTNTEQGLYRVDPETGDREVVSGPGVGDGPAFEGFFGLAVVPVPEPAGAAMMALLVAGFGQAFRRRSQVRSDGGDAGPTLTVRRIDSARRSSAGSPPGTPSCRMTRCPPRC